MTFFVNHDGANTYAIVFIVLYAPFLLLIMIPVDHHHPARPRRRFVVPVLLAVLLLGGTATQLRRVALALRAFVSIVSTQDRVRATKGSRTATMQTSMGPSSSVPTTAPSITTPSPVPSVRTSTPSIPASSSSSSTQKSIRPKSVYLWTNDKNVDNEMKHFIVDGVEHSPYITRIYETDALYNRSSSSSNTSLLWIADTGTGRRPSRWCEALTEAVDLRLNQTKRAPFPLYIFHWGDDPAMPIRFQHCDDLYPLLGLSNIRYFKRSMVVDRIWNNASNAIQLGKIDPMHASNYSYWSGKPIEHVSYGVRSDTVSSIESFLRQDMNMTLSSVYSLDMASVLPRPLDVAHFWPPPGLPGFGRVDRGGKTHHNSRLRDAVSKAIWDWNRVTDNVTGFAGLVGQANLAGRRNVQDAYVHALLSYKIIVVAQKDNWEDHYRLMEALCTGALVFTDRMLLLPEGLEDGRNIVLYDNVTDMMWKIEHYLWHVNKTDREAIARAGWRTAMTRHRSWHIMEKALFGRIMSTHPGGRLV